MNRAGAIGSLAALVAAAVAAPARAATSATTLGPVLEASDWINGHVDAASLRGRVVIVDVFTFGCYNCRNVTPNLRRLHRTVASSNLVIIGVHAPETPYERDRANVVTTLRELGVVWPVAIDNDFRIWNAYGVEAWPTQLVFDRRGILRTRIVGDSQDADVDRAVAMLEAGAA